MEADQGILEGKPYKVIVLEDYEALLKVTLECLRAFDFEASGFRTCEELLDSAWLNPFDVRSLPDLFIVDVLLYNGVKTGIDLIQELAERDVPSEIIAVSGNFAGTEVVDNLVCFGSSAFLPKPFSMFDLCEKAERMAQIGRKRRLRRLQSAHMRYALTDEARMHREVFLNYAKQDRVIANGLRRHLEFRAISVWYTPASIEIADRWRKRIEEGIDEASVFIVLLSDHFLRSACCMAELTRIERRMEHDTEEKLLLLPVLGELSEHNRENNEDMKRVFRKYQYRSLFPDLIDSLTVISERIEWALHRKKMGGSLG